MLPATIADATAELTPDYLRTLNVAQRLAVEHGVGSARVAPGPLLIIAGAGSGKTNTLAHRVAHLLVCGADPQRLLLLTFSRRAAAEMERRAGLLLQRVLTPRALTPPGLPWSGTFHAIAARLLREYAPRIGLDPQFTIHDRGDSEDLLALVRHEAGLTATPQRFPAKATCLAIYSRTVNSESPLSDVLARTFTWGVPWEAQLRALFEAYVTAKQAQNVLDFDDLLLYWAHMMEEPAIAAEIGGRFDHVLVDEYQDTNRLQASILLKMKPAGQGLTVVGDDAQAIYSFRAATVRNILDFPQQFTPPAQVITLERNYRSTQAILAASNAVIGLARERFTKNLWSERVSPQKPELVTVRDEADQAQCVAERILAYRETGIALKAQAVLFRSSGHSAQLELELARRRIPFVKYGGLKFLEAAHVKDVLCILRWADNPRGRIAGFRATQLLPGIGPASAGRLLNAIAEAADPVATMRAFTPTAATGDAWQAFTELIGSLRSPAAAWPAALEWVTRWYAPHLERLHEDARARMGDLVQLQAIAATYPSRERFLTEVTLDPPAATSDEAGVPRRDDDYLILSTIHSAKGQEWKTVQVLNVVDGCIPSDMATGTSDEIEEERRLLYVAMTRARDHLHLMVPQRFHVHQQTGFGDRHLYASRSRFLPEAIVPLFERTAWPVVAPAVMGTQVVCEKPSIDIGARLRAAWR